MPSLSAVLSTLNLYQYTLYYKSIVIVQAPNYVGCSEEKGEYPLNGRYIYSALLDKEQVYNLLIFATDQDFFLLQKKNNLELKTIELWILRSMLDLHFLLISRLIYS